MVDAGYPNRLGYLAPYKGQMYHVPDWRRGSAPSGEQETFNYFHSIIHNVVENNFIRKNHALDRHFHICD
jgi:hypothetical protein